MREPSLRPAEPRFGSGPTRKRPGWSAAALDLAHLGRSHRAADVKAKLVEVAEHSRAILGIPADYRIGIMPGSDTGAFEAAMWSLLGARGVDVLAFESFGEGWANDLETQLRLTDLRVFRAPYGTLPDLRSIDPDRDLVFCWNGTTSGVRVPDDDWLQPGRRGLVLCDATSAAFAMPLPWPKLDVVTWSWQKVLGGEAQHGMLVLSPRAVERLETYAPSWPVPKVFRLTKNGKLIEGIFKGETINTPSMLAVADALDGLDWAESVGGLAGLIARAERNLDTLEVWAEGSGWAAFLAEDPAIRSCTSVCLRITDPLVSSLDPPGQRRFVQEMTARLAQKGVAYDIAAYRDAPPGLRIWCGATVEAADIQALTAWLDWAFHQGRQSLAEAGQAPLPQPEQQRN